MQTSATTLPTASQKETATSAGTLRRSANGAQDRGIPSESESANGSASAGSTSAAGALATTQGTSVTRTTAQADAGNHGAKKDDATNAGSIMPDQSRAVEEKLISEPAPQPTPSNESSATDTTIPLPEVVENENETGDATPETSQVGTQSKFAPLLGYWRQVDTTQHQPDFAPGGFDQSILAIRPTQRSMQLYRSWGTPSQLVIAAELRATFDLNDGVVFTENPSTPCRFLTTALELPAQANQAKRSVIPPAQALPYTAKWSVEKDGSLHMDSKVYQRINRSEFESATQVKSGIAANGNSRPKNSNTAKNAQKSDTPDGGVDFFGTRVRGKYICFVCDISGSMDGDKLIALRAELTRTIQSLSKGSHFLVIFFSSDAYVLEADWVLAGTAKARDYLRKIQEVGSSGGTDPTNALKYAFTQLNPIPHELFLLTDGHFGADPNFILQQYNGGADQTRIHTIGLGQDVDPTQLAAIAKTYGGQYRAIATQAIPPPMP